MSRFVAGLAAVVVFLSACGEGSGPKPPQEPVAARLSFAATPSPATAGQVLWPIEVYVLDERGVLVSAAVEVTLAASAGTLGGTT